MHLDGSMSIPLEKRVYHRHEKFNSRLTSIDAKGSGVIAVDKQVIANSTSQAEENSGFSFDDSF